MPQCSLKSPRRAASGLGQPRVAPGGSAGSLHLPRHGSSGGWKDPYHQPRCPSAREAPPPPAFQGQGQPPLLRPHPLWPQGQTRPQPPGPLSEEAAVRWPPPPQSRQAPPSFSQLLSPPLPPFPPAAQEECWPAQATEPSPQSSPPRGLPPQEEGKQRAMAPQPWAPQAPQWCQSALQACGAFAASSPRGYWQENSKNPSGGTF